MTETLITCPSCSHSFPPEKALEQAISVKLENEFKIREATLLETAGQEAEIKLRAQFTDQLRESSEKIDKLNQEQKVLLQRSQEIEQKEKNLESIITQERKNYETQINERMLNKYEDLKKDLDKEKQSLENLYRKRVTEEMDKARLANDLAVRELKKQLEDQGNLIEEMKRKHQQGSMQLQGEVAELYIEELLKTSYPQDDIQPVAKGITGADTIQTVFNGQQVACGKIIYESKRTKHFGVDWIEKLKNDMRASGCDVAVLVTEVMPKDMTRFGLLEGVWVCSFHEIRSLSLVLRAGLLRAGELIQAQHNQGTKMQLLYNFLTGPQFRGYVETIVEGFSALKENLDKEKKVTYKLWAERERQIEKVIQGTSSMYGSIQGISGTAMPLVKGLEADTLLLEQ